MTTFADVRPVTRRGFVAVVLLLVTLACTGNRAPTTSSGGGSFAGSWTANGSRRVLEMGDGRTVSLLDLKGSLLLSGDTRPAKGFRADALILNDSVTGLVGRAAWIDERGEKVFSELASDAPGSLHIVGTIVGGTGRFAGATGRYEFTFGHILVSEDGVASGRADDLKGTFSVGGGG